MPRCCSPHVRYPVDLFLVQAQIYATYHMTRPRVLYNKGNQWATPTGARSPRPSGQMEPYYVNMQLPGQIRDEFVLILPFTPYGRTTWWRGWRGAVRRAQLRPALGYAFPKARTVYGPTQIEARSTRTRPSRATDAVEQQGSKV